MAKSIRIIDIWMYINNKTVFTAQELADEFQVSLRTIQRDLDELSLLGVPFYSEIGRNGGYRMLHNNLLPPISFSFSETLSILITYETLNYYVDHPLSVESTKVQEKLFMQLPEDKREEARKIKEHLIMWQCSESYQADYVEDILKAAVNKNEIEITYESKNQQSIKKLVPLGIFGMNNNWYFSGYDKLIKEIRMYRCDRVMKLAVLDEIEDEFISLKEWLNSYFEIEDGIKVKMQLTRKGCFELNSMFPIPLDKITENEIVHYEVTLPRDDMSYFIKQFLNLGKEIKIIEPKEIIDKMKEELKEINNYFENNY